MSEREQKLEVLSKLGTAKIAGLTCNKKAPVLLRLDVEFPIEHLEEALKALGLEATDVLIDDLNKTLEVLKKTKKPQ